jgi:hypothetical protein
MALHPIIGIQVAPSWGHDERDPEVIEQAINLAKRLGVNVHLVDEREGHDGLLVIEPQGTVEGVLKQW